MIKPFNEVYNQCDSLTLDVTEGCNLNCSYCFEKNKSGKMMDFETARKYIDATYHVLPGESKFMINLFGGEPMLNWSLIKQIIDYCDDMCYKVKFGITTNLTILTEEMIDYIDNFGIGLLVSIDGIKSVHDANRCNSYDKVIANLKRLEDRKCMLLVEARPTIDPSQVDHFYESIVHIYEDLHIDNISPMPVTDKEWTNEQIVVYRDQYRKILKFYLEKVQDVSSHRHIYIKPVDECLGNVLSELAIDNTMCALDNMHWISVDCDGKVYQCHQLPYDKSIDSSIGTLEDGIDTDKIIKDLSFLHQEECKTCISKAICKAGCPMENRRVNNNVSKPSKFFCKLITIHLMVAKEYRPELLNIKQFNSCYLTVVKENIKLVDYITNILTTSDIWSPEFHIQMLNIQERIDALNDAGKLLPTYHHYLINLFNILFTIIMHNDRSMNVAKALEIVNQNVKRNPLID